MILVWTWLIPLGCWMDGRKDRWMDDMYEDWTHGAVSCEKYSESHLVYLRSLAMALLAQ